MKADDTLDDAAFPVSRTTLGLFLIAVVLSTGTGCRLCCDAEDNDYPAYGGVWERTNRSSGRVGSLFDPGGARVANLLPRDSADGDNDGQTDLFPFDDQIGNEPEEDPEVDSPKQESGPEDDKKFQERQKKFEEENMLNASIVPGTLQPPDLRY